MPNFWSAIFTNSLIVVVSGVLTVAGVLLEIFAIPSTVDWRWKLVSVVFTVLLFLLLLFYYRALEFYNSYSRRIPVIRQVQSERDPALTIVVIKNPGYLREGCLLTLRSSTSGAAQALAILEVTNATPGEEIQTVPFPRGSAIEDIGRLITGLYATPIIHLTEVRNIMRYVDSTQGAALRSAVGNPSLLVELNRWSEIFESE